MLSRPSCKRIREVSRAGGAFGFRLLVVLQLAFLTGVSCRGCDTDEEEFSAMSDFYGAYRNGDWSQMTLVARRFKSVDVWFDKLVAGAQALTSVAAQDTDTKWSHGEAIRPHQMIGIAAHLVAASQSVREPKRATFTKEQRSAIRRAWLEMLLVAYNAIGVSDEPPPGRIEVALATDYLEGAKAVAALLEDVCSVVTQQAMAWLAKRRNDDATAERLKVRDLLWPPVVRKEGKLMLQMPELEGLEKF
jgi:hypothetical protein